MIEAEESSCSSISTLNFISNNNCSVIITQVPDKLHEAFCCQVNTANPLYAFYYNCCNFFSMLSEIGYKSLFIIKGKKCYVISFIYRCNDPGIIGSRNR